MRINITYEQALAKASPILRRKMEHTREVILKALPLALKYDKNGFWVGFSGGKDSQALYHMMQLCEVPMHAYFSPTSIDPPENIRFIKTHYPEVEFVKITTNIFEVFKQMKVLPSMKIRWCCAYFKERGGEGKVVCTGVRKAESVRRSKRNEIEVTGRKFSGHIDEFESWQEKRILKQLKNLNQDQFSEAKETEVRCINGHDKILLNPIIEWTEADVWEFLNKVLEVPHCELYDEGWTRIGCTLCPLASIKSTVRDLKRWPHVKEKWIKAIMSVRKESILNGGNVWRDELDRGIDSISTPPQFQNCSISSLQSTESLPPNFQVGQVSSPEWEQRNGDSARAFSNCKIGFWRGIQSWGGAKDLSKTTPRKLVGKFLDSGNGESSAVTAEYNEEQERQIAEEIFSWWISKKSFKQWFAERFQQGKLFDDSDY